MDMSNTSNQRRAGLGIIPIILFGIVIVVIGYIVGFGLQQFNIPFAGVVPLILPEQASAQAQRTDALFQVFIAIGTVVFLLVQGLLLYSVIRFRARANDTADGPAIHGNAMLEIVWTIIPAIIVVVLSILSFIVWTENTEAFAPEDVNLVEGHPIEIDAVGQRFQWGFAYHTNEVNDQGSPIVLNSNNLHIYNGQNVYLEMNTPDVIHSFWVPAMRIKQDLLPGRTTEVRFTPQDSGDGFEFVNIALPAQVYAEPDANSDIIFEAPLPQEDAVAFPAKFRVVEPTAAIAEWIQVELDNGASGWVALESLLGRHNEYRLICTELCGGGHGDMFTHLFVYDGEGSMLASWFNPAVEQSRSFISDPIERGRQILADGAYPCAGCHVLDELGWAGQVGPSLNGIGARMLERASAAGVELEPPAAYLVQSIRQPNAYIIEGYAGAMPQFAPGSPPDAMPQDDLEAIVAYLCAQTGTDNLSDSTCGLENWQFDGDRLTDENALNDELSAVAEEYEE